MTPFAGLKELADAAAWAIAARVNWPGLALGDSVISRAVDDRLGAHEGKAPPSTLSDRYSWVRRPCPKHPAATPKRRQRLRCDP